MLFDYSFRGAARIATCVLATLLVSPTYGQFRDITPGRAKEKSKAPTQEPASAESTSDESTSKEVNPLAPKTQDAAESIIESGTTTETPVATSTEPALQISLPSINPPIRLGFDSEAAAIIGALNPPHLGTTTTAAPLAEDNAVMSIIANPLTNQSVSTVVETTTTTQTTIADKNYLVGEALGEQTQEEPTPEEEGPIRPVRFNGVLVGTTTIEKANRLWGEPFKVVRSQEFDIYKYRRKPFRQIDLTVAQSKVIDILIHLRDPLDPVHCASELGLSELTAVPIPDDDGQVMGLSYPERGVLFSFLAGDPDSLVSKIHLEPINPEPFVLRAQYDFDRHFEKDLADLDTATEMSPRYAKAYWAKAEVLESIGRYHDALDAANQAVQYDADNIHYALTHTRILAANGQYDAAMNETRELLEIDDLTPALNALAELQMGNLIAEGPTPQFKKAMQHHLRAIDLAAPLANDRRFVPRRLAKHVLIDAHLAVARNISRGDYQRQTEVAPKWLSRGRALVEELIKRDQGDPALRLKVHRYIMATAADLYNMDDPTRIIDDMLTEGRRLIRDTSDTINANRIEWELGQAIAEAVRLQRSRGAYDEAIQLADDALVLMQQSARKRQSTPLQKLIVGRLYFHVGSLQAVHQKNHEEAIEWYEKAQKLLMNDVPVSVFAQPQVYGEYFISMGVSYWKRNQENRAIELSEFGADIIQQAVVDGILPSETLAIPYGNLASMHHQAGNEADARAFTELAAGLGKGPPIR